MSSSEPGNAGDDPLTWKVQLSVEIRNPEPGEEPHDEDADLPDSARSQRLYEALDTRQPPSEGPWPTQIVRTDDGYAVTTFLVAAADRLGALQRGAEVTAAALADAEIDAGPFSLSISGLEEGDAPDPDHDLDFEGPEVDDEEAAEELEQDADFARAWGVDDPLAQGALRESAIAILDEVDGAFHEVLHGASVGETYFVEDYLPGAFSRAYDEEFLLRFRVCLVLMGYKLAQDPAIRPGCVAEMLALEVIRRRAHGRLEEVGADGEHIEALRALYEVGGDDGILDLYDMEEPADAAVHGHDPTRAPGKVDMRVEAWFAPLWGGADGTAPHPVCE
jgi:hypothetical protein